MLSSQPNRLGFTMHSAPRSPNPSLVSAPTSADEWLALVAAGAHCWLLRQRVLAPGEDTYGDCGVPADSFRSAVATGIPAWILPDDTP